MISVRHLRRILLTSMLLISIALWVISWGVYHWWFRSFRTVIDMRNGVLHWVGPFPYVFTYEMHRPVLALLVLSVASECFRYLRSEWGLALFTVFLHVAICGYGNELAYLPVAIFDVVLVINSVMAPTGIKRHGPTICIKCGYDLRATPNRCPECGTAVWRLGSDIKGNER